MFASFLTFFFALSSLVGGVQLEVAGSGGNSSSPIQYGLIFEDISHSGDGGIYAELIQNRAFQAVNFTSATVDPWVSVNGAELKLQKINPLSEALPFSVKVSRPSVNAGQIGLSNPGWWGIDVKPQTYTGSFYVRGTYDGIMTASLKSNRSSETFASAAMHVKSVKNKWSQFNFTLAPKDAAKNTNNTFDITFSSSKATDGSLSFNLLSLFPPTYNARPNGMRVDIMNALKATHPKFLRFPGGNNLEGLGLAEYSPRWIWNNTIGPLTNRPGRLGTWTYYNTDGLGLNEYLVWCKDLNMEPLLAIWSGHYLDDKSIKRGKLQPYVQDALNQLEYLMGSTSTKYGALRASNGYPKPWKIRYIEIGNEDNLSNGLASYSAYRFKAFYDAIHAAYPDITIIASTISINIPKGAGGDYHIYTTPDTLVSSFNFFDNQSTATYSLAGEYSAQTPNGGSAAALAPFWIGSVAEAIYNLGIERNTGKVLGSTYAPILQNTNPGAYQWTPNLVSFNADPAQTVRSTSVHTLSLLADNLFTTTREVTSSLANGDEGVFWVAGFSETSDAYLLKTAVYNSTDSRNVPMHVRFDGIGNGTRARLTVLTADDPYASVVAGQPDPVKQATSIITAGKAGYFRYELPNLSVAVLKTL